MSSLLGALFGRLPIGWLQLKHNRSRLFAALAGVAFANILILAQLGFLGALQETVRIPYQLFTADIMISASDTNTLTDGSNVPRQSMYRALGVPGVANAAPLYVAKMDLRQPGGSTANLHVYGVIPSNSALDDAFFGGAIRRIGLLDRVLIDSMMRGGEPDTLAALRAGEPLRFETNGRTLQVAGTFQIGGGFDADGYLVTSDQTFLSLFPGRVAGAPSHVLIDLAAGADRVAVLDALRNTLPAGQVKVRTVAQASEADVSYQSTQRPVGLIFGFGVVIGVIVGLIIVYQVLSTDVADHLKEYATLKAVGYRQGFFLGIVFEEALVLAVLGFIPGILIALVIYEGVTAATGLPVEMNAVRMFSVLVGTTAMCFLSGAIATRRLAGADPADLF